MNLIDDNMTIDLNELQKILSLLMVSFKEKNGDKIELKNDYYWNIFEEEIYNLNEEPKDLSLGQLTDDWETLKKSANSDILIPYDLQRISNILRALSIENPI